MITFKGVSAALNLKEVQELLSQNNIIFHPVHYKNEAEFFNHIELFPYTAKCKKGETISLTILSKNEKKNIEIQFNESSEGFLFEELWFGGYSFEMFDVSEEYIASELLSQINDIMERKMVFIEAHDMKKKCWLGDAVFDYKETGDVFGVSGYRRALQRIEKPKSLFSKIIKSKKRYEIFDWETYRLIEK